MAHKSFECQECGKLFAKPVETCTGCGGSDIDVYCKKVVGEVPKISTARKDMPFEVLRFENEMEYGRQWIVRAAEALRHRADDTARYAERYADAVDEGGTDVTPEDILSWVVNELMGAMNALDVSRALTAAVRISQSRIQAEPLLGEMGSESDLGPAREAYRESVRRAKA